MPETLIAPVQPALETWSETWETKTLRAEFEGGYSQRLQLGPNNTVQSLQLEWLPLSGAQKAQMTAFLKARGGAEAFFYTPPGGAQGLWSCPSWSAARLTWDIWKLSATLKQEFDLT